MEKKIALDPEVEKRLKLKDQIFEESVRAIGEKQKTRNRSTFLDSGEENEWNDTQRQRSKK